MAGFLSGPTTDQWLIDAESIFSEHESEQGIGQTTTLKTLFNDIYVVYKNNLKAWWEIKSLENYIKQNIIPKGLRINIAPSHKTSSPQVLGQWEK